MSFFPRVVRLDRVTSAGPVLARVSVAIPCDGGGDIIVSNIALVKSRGSEWISFPSHVDPDTGERVFDIEFPLALERAIKSAIWSAWADQRAEARGAVDVPLPPRYVARGAV
jgi:DNA-binding cell septation regulator SpoVG